MAEGNAAKDIEEGKALAGIMYLLQIVGIVGIVGAVILWAVKKENRFIDYHFKQLLCLWISGLIVGVVGAITMIILIGFVILGVGGLLLLIIWIIGIINAFTGKQTPLPIIGKWGESFKF